MEDNTILNVQDQKKKETQRFHKYLKDGEAQLKDSDRRIVSHNLFDILQELTDQGILKTKSDVDKIGGSHRLPRFALSRALSDEEFNKRAKDNNLTRKWTGYYTVISEVAEKEGEDKNYYLLEGDTQSDYADLLMKAVIKKIESFRNYKDRMHLLKKQKLKKFKERWKAN